jgi:hypothetical protein
MISSACASEPFHSSLVDQTSIVDRLVRRGQVNTSEVHGISFMVQRSIRLTFCSIFRFVQRNIVPVSESEMIEIFQPDLNAPVQIRGTAPLAERKPTAWLR